MNKRNNGHSLVETMIYMILGIIVIGYALSSMTHISKGYVKSRTVMKMQKDGRDAVQIMAREIGNTGFKYYIQTEDREVTKDFDGDGTVVSSGGTDNETNVMMTHYFTRPSKEPHSITTDFTTATPTVELLDADSLWLLAAYTGPFNDDGAFRNGFEEDSAASFFFWESNTTLSDTLEIYRSRLSGTNSLRDVQRIKYFLSTDTLFREEWTAQAGTGAGELDNTYGSVPEASSEIWAKAEKINMALIENAKALQFQFSENGRDWKNDPAGRRHLVKQIKIQLLVASNREFDERYAVNYDLGVEVAGGTPDVSVSGTADGAIYRLYEKIVEVPNNGVLLD